MGGRFSPISADMPDEAVASLTLSEDGDVWMGTVNRGLMRFSASRGLEHLDTDMGLPNNRVPSLFIDREQNVWAGTNAGLVRLADTPFISYDQQLGLSNDYVRSEEHTSELQSLMRISYAVFCSTTKTHP